MTRGTLTTVSQVAQVIDAKKALTWGQVLFEDDPEGVSPAQRSLSYQTISCDKRKSGAEVAGATRCMLGEHLDRPQPT